MTHTLWPSCSIRFDFTEYNADELNELQDVIDEVGSVMDRAADQIDATDINEGPDA